MVEDERRRGEGGGGGGENYVSWIPLNKNILRVFQLGSSKVLMFTIFSIKNLLLDNTKEKGYSQER
jgi:hypothetical protein